MTARPTSPLPRATRRGILAGGIGLLGLALTGCFSTRSDIPAVTAAMQAAVEKVPGYLRGTVHFQDGFSQGTVINAIIAVNTTTREETAQVLRAMLEAVIGVYVEQPNVRRASVLVEAHQEDDRNARVKAIDVIDSTESATVSTDDLKREFGL